MSKTVLFQVIQFSSIWPINRTLSSATHLGQSEPGNDGNERVLCILQSFNITGTPSSDCLVSYPGHTWGGGVLSLCRDAVAVSRSPSRLGNWSLIRFINFCLPSLSPIEHFIPEQVIFVGVLIKWFIFGGSRVFKESRNFWVVTYDPHLELSCSHAKNTTTKRPFCQPTKGSWIQERDTQHLEIWGFIASAVVSD